MRSFKIWLLYTKNSFLQTLSNRVFFGLFLFGKSARVLMFLGFLYFLLNSTQGMAGYSKDQIIFFYLSFNLIDAAAQFLFREVYRFRELVISGDLDLILVKPINPLLRVLLGGTDLLDLLMLIFITAAVVYTGMGISLSAVNWMVYLSLMLNSLILAAAFHILILTLCVLTTSIDHLTMVFRDTMAMLRIPVDVYSEPLRGILTFVVPLGIMMTFPPKALMGLLSGPLIFTSFFIAFLTLASTLFFWKRSLREYQSASS
jgi:ABC-2 type transport system permease protein